MWKSGAEVVEGEANEEAEKDEEEEEEKVSRGRGEDPVNFLNILINVGIQI